MTMDRTADKRKVDDGGGSLHGLGSTGRTDDAGYEEQYGVVTDCYLYRVNGDLVTVIDVPGCAIHTIHERNAIPVDPKSCVGRIMRVYYKAPLDCFFEWAEKFLFA